MCQGFRERKIHTGGRVLLAGVNLYVGYKLGVATADTVHSGTDNTRTVKQKLRQSRSILPLPRAVCRKTWTEPQSLKIFIENQHTQTKFRRHSVDCRNPCSPRTGGNPYFRHTPTDRLHCRVWQPDYSRHYCEKYFRKLFILALT